MLKLQPMPRVSCGENRSLLARLLLSGATLLSLTGCFVPGFAASGGVPEDNLKTLLNTNACVNCELSGVDLSGINLRQANLRGANLFRANLVNTQLQDANLSGAQLSSANLDRANLQQANLTNIEVYKTNFVGANLNGADLSNNQLFNANFKKANLQGANLSGTRYVTVDLSGANLKNTKGLDLASQLKIAPKWGITLDRNTVLPDGSTYMMNAKQKDHPDAIAPPKPKRPTIAHHLP